MTRIEEILKPLTVNERLAIISALYHAQADGEQFVRAYGTMGMASVNELLSDQNLAKKPAGGRHG
jgi:hypothetical protein